MAESLGTATLTLEANAGPLTSALAATRARVLGGMGATGRMSGAALAAGVAAAGVAIGVALYKIGKNYANAYNIIAAQTGATGVELDKLKESFKNVYGRTAADAETVAKALSEVKKRTELTGEPLEELTLSFIRLGSITGEDVNTSIRQVTRAFNFWGVKTEDQGAKLDAFFVLAQETGVSVGDLAEQVTKFGAPLQDMGFSLDESAAMLASFEEAGVNAQGILPGFKVGLANLTDPSDDLAKRMKALGISADRPKEALVKLMGAIKGAGSEAEGRKLALEVFGKRAGTDLAKAVRKGSFSVDDLTDKMKNSKGAIEDAVPKTFEGRMKMVGHLLTNIVEPAATELLGVVIDVAGKILDFTKTLDGKMSPGLKKAVGTVVMAVGAFGLLMFALTKVKALFVAMKLTMLANPYVLIIAATVGLVYLIVKNWDKIKEFLADTWEKIKNGISVAWDFIVKLFKKYWKYIALAPLGPMALLIAIVVKHWDKVKDLTSKVWERIKQLIVRLFGGAVDAIKSAGSRLRSWMSDLWSGTRSRASAAWQAIKSVIVTPFRSAADAVRSIAGSLGSGLRRAWQGLRGIASSVWNGVKDATVGTVGKMYQGAVNIFNALKSAVLSVWNYVTEKVSSIWDSIKSLPGKAVSKLWSAATSSVSPFSAASSAVGVTGLSSAASVPSVGMATGQSPDVNVSVTFADGMGWLKDFVDVRISEQGRTDYHTYVAGGGGY